MSACTQHTSSKALGTLVNIRERVTEMQEALDSLKQQLGEKSTELSHLLSTMTAKSCQRERASALLGHGGAVLSTMKMMSEQKRMLVENEEDDSELLAVFAEGLTRKSSRIDVMLERAREQLAVAEQEEKETRELAKKTKEQVRIS